MRRLFMLLILISLTCGCSGDTTSVTDDATSDDSIRIGVMPKLVGISYFEATEKGAMEAGEELGLNVHFDGPTAASHEEQVRMLDTWIAQGYDCIAVAPNDPDAVASTLRAAEKDGITVLTWDTDANPETSRRLIFVNQATNQQIAENLVNMMVDGIKDREAELAGKYLLVSGTPTASNQNTWMALMREIIAEKHPEMELLEPLMPGEDQSKAQEMSAAAINAQPDIKGIWGMTSVAVPGAAKAVKDAGLVDSVVVTGVSLPSIMREYVDDGTVARFALCNPVDLGYLTVHMAAYLKENESIADGTYDFGRLKQVVVVDGQAILGPHIVFTADNIDQYDF